MSLPYGYDLVYVDDGDSEGYDLINPEGETFVSVRYALDISPGRITLLQEAEERCEWGYRNRSILENEASAFYTRGRNHEQS